MCLAVTRKKSEQVHRDIHKVMFSMYIYRERLIHMYVYSLGIGKRIGKNDIRIYLCVILDILIHCLFVIKIMKVMKP